MQATLRISQARPRARFCEAIRHHVRQLTALFGEVLALACLTLAMATGLLLLTGLPR